MQQTALNLIAIGVFTITFFSLIGPIFHLSPFIPATTTLVILGLATIDTLGWESKGVTLLLDAFAPREQRQRIIHHEAGHFLAAYLLHIPITGYTLTAWEAFKQGKPGAGGVTFDTQVLSTATVKEMPLIIDRFCTVWMAGIAAEKIIYGNTSGGAEDVQKVKAILLEAGFTGDTTQKERWSLLQATNLIQQNEKAYHALVQAMTAKATVAECYNSIIHNIDRQGA